MAGRTIIFVEGTGDVKFVSDYISHIRPDVKVSNKIEAVNIYNNKTPVAVIHSLNGWTNIENAKPVIEKYNDQKYNVLVILDADTKDNNGGFARRKEEIEDYKLQLDGIFLFPNNEDDGGLEDLLENIINQANKPIFECWNGFETCLQECASKKIRKELTIPAKKSKIYVYLETLLGKTSEEKKKVKDPNREYKVTEHWNLDADYLIPLKNFLEKYLK